MKRIFVLTATVLAIFSLSAQNVDGGATELLKKVSAQYRKYSTMQFNFTLKTAKNDKTISTTKGSFQIKGNKYKSSYDDQQFFCNGESIWNYQKSTNEVSIYEYDPDDDQNIMNPQKMLIGWDRHFRAKFIREETSNGVLLSIIDLTPKTQQSYYRIRVFVQKSAMKIAKVTVYEKDNTTYTYSIEQFKSDIPIDDNVFRFDEKQYPGVDINDMR